MTGASLVSCVIPVFNGERFLGEALESVFAQTYRPLEVVVVDDGSSDGTARILAGFGSRIELINQANAGPAAARNRGVEAARGDWIAFLDADDLWLHDKLDRQMACLAAHPGADVCLCRVQNFWEPQLAAEAARLRGTVHARPYRASWPGLLARRDVFDRIGALDPGLTHRDFGDWLQRARVRGIETANCDDVLVRRRIHEGNISRRRGADEAAELLDLAERALARRRALDT